ncbi:class I SAM-dependent methyltransferase [candidate division KSB1 bacterium]|nr:MAG: class I SAM-dependent methyltransferase [candidate division KSB1 bacterium]
MGRHQHGHHPEHHCICDDLFLAARRRTISLVMQRKARANTGFFSNTSMQIRNCPVCRLNKTRLKYSVDEFRIVTCRECGFVYLANPIALEDEQHNYERYFRSADLPEYSAASSDENIRGAWRINEQRLGWIKAHRQTGALLDVGCGRGYFLEHAQQHGFIVEGVEISRLAGAYASEHLNITVHICSIEKEFNLTGSYDIITLWHVLEHMHNPRAALENVWSLLKPGGILFIQVPNLHSLKFQLSPAARKWRGGNHPRYHRSFFTRASLHLLLEACGLENYADSHLIYRTSDKYLARLAKRVLNSGDLDSFLDIAVFKEQASMFISTQ